MDILIKDAAEEAVKADIVILPFFEDSSPESYSTLDSLTGGMIRRVVEEKEFTGKQNQLSLLHVKNSNAGRILLTGMGKSSSLSPEKIRQAGGKALSYVQGLGLRDAAVAARRFREGSVAFTGKRSPEYYFAEGGLLALYRFEKYRKQENGTKIRSLILLGGDRSLPLKQLQATAAAVHFARDLVNTPSNDMTPSHLGEVAKNLAGRNVRVTVLEEKEIGKKGMGAYLAVARGSAQPPKFIILEYKGGKGNPVVLVGKSITFDSGGISIKPAEGMEKMKYDMSGGAAVLAVIKAAAELFLPVNITALLPAAENLPGGTAYRPGDVVRTLSGRTVEIISTDAEGRLALADALGYALRYCRPKAVIDIATLTGACSVALGGEAIAMMGSDRRLMELLKGAAEETFERVWEMPLYDEYKEYLKSDIADLKNAGGRGGSLVTAGCFLREFAGDTPWVHLDIAGTAWNDKEKPYAPRGATGIGVRLLLGFLERTSASEHNI
ncbi:MAG: leucyl aminopeptidase [Nitrospirales bacterium]|nr:leucyl aminopeptidase [Nitrospirales bacterium]